MLRSQFPMFMGWGSELTMFYNDAYIAVLGAKHPNALGARTEQVWAEIWDVLGPLAREVLAGGANFAEDLLLRMQRAGFVEETYFTFSYSPILTDHTGQTGAVGGLFCACVETTDRVIGERRLRLLSELGEVSAATAPTPEQACTAAVSVLSRGCADVPLAVAYLLDTDAATARRVAFYGVHDTVLAPATLDLRADAQRSIWSVVATGTPQLVGGLAARYTGMFVELDGPMGHTDPDAVMLWPLAPAGGGTPVGVLVTGVSPFRELDTDYHRFLELVAGQLAKAIADAHAVGAQRRRAEELAELDRAKTEFFTGVSHELRTPLTLIAGPAQDALADTGEPLPARQRQRVELIRRNSGRLGRLIDTLLEFSRIEGGHHHPELVATELAEFTRGITESFAPAATRAGLELVIDCPPLPTAMLVDHSMWEKIVLNLLSNAVKYTPAGTITVRLRAARRTAGRR